MIIRFPSDWISLYNQTCRGYSFETANISGKKIAPKWNKQAGTAGYGVDMEEEILSKTEGNDRNTFPLTMLFGGAGIVLLQQWVLPSAYKDQRWVVQIFFVLGIVFFFFGAWTIDKNRMPKWLVKGVNGVSGWFRISPNQLFYLFYSIILVITASIAAGYEAKMLNRWQPCYPGEAQFFWWLQRPGSRESKRSADHTPSFYGH